MIMGLIVCEFNVETVFNTHLHLNRDIVVLLELGVGDLNSEVDLFGDFSVVVSVDRDSEEVSHLTSYTFERLILLLEPTELEGEALLLS